MNEQNKTTKIINGAIYRGMIESAANALENDKERINDLNVFPVPDGDTGVNMSLTMTPAREPNDDFQGTIHHVASLMSRAFLRSARGNSGVILSSFFRGVSKGLRECTEADAPKIAAAFKVGVEAAYRSVMTPTEGTILTVMRACAEKAAEIMEGQANAAKEDIEALFTEMLAAAEDMLAKTPDMLPALKQANVVDAGGSGFVAVLGGMLSALRGEPVALNAPASSDGTNKQADFSKFATEDITFPYCTECIVTKDKKFEGEGNAEELHSFIMSVGDSVVFVEDVDIIKLHVHTDDPGRVLSEAVKYGMFYTVKIENMKNQHSGLIEEQKEEKAEDNGIVSVPAEKPYGFVSVCSGEGIKSVFSDLGVDKIVTGGQTMNPSTDDMLRAIAATPAETVFVLPNNSNIYLVAKTAAELTKDKRVEVLKTVSVPQGVSAMFAFSEELSPEENRAEMEKRIAETNTASITYAAHDSNFDGKKITMGQMLGLVENKVKYVTDTREECLALVSDAVKKKSIITVYYGEDVTEQEAEKAVEIISANVNPYAEVTLIPGGQPVYAYIISGEDA